MLDGKYNTKHTKGTQDSGYLWRIINFDTARSYAKLMSQTSSLKFSNVLSVSHA